MAGLASSPGNAPGSSERREPIISQETYPPGFSPFRTSLDPVPEDEDGESATEDEPEEAPVSNEPTHPPGLPMPQTAVARNDSQQPQQVEPAPEHSNQSTQTTLYMPAMVQNRQAESQQVPALNDFQTPPRTGYQPYPSAAQLPTRLGIHLGGSTPDTAASKQGLPAASATRAVDITSAGSPTIWSPEFQHAASVTVNQGSSPLSATPQSYHSLEAAQLADMVATIKARGVWLGQSGSINTSEHANPVMQQQMPAAQDINIQPRGSSFFTMDTAGGLTGQQDIKFWLRQNRQPHAAAGEFRGPVSMWSTPFPAAAPASPEPQLKMWGAQAIAGNKPNDRSPDATFKTALESPDSSKQSSQTTGESLTAQSHFAGELQQSATSAVPSFAQTATAWAGATRDSRTIAADTAACPQSLFMPAATVDHSIDLQESDGYSDHEPVQRGHSFSSLQTMDEEPYEGTPSTPNDSMVGTGKASFKTAAGKLVPAAGGRRKRGGRGRNHSGKQQNRDLSSSPATPRNGASHRVHKPGGPLKLSDMVIPALKAKARQKGLPFVTSPEKVPEPEEEIKAEEESVEKAETTSEPRTSAVCDSRSFAEVARDWGSVAPIFVGDEQQNGVKAAAKQQPLSQLPVDQVSADLEDTATSGHRTFGFRPLPRIPPLPSPTYFTAPMIRQPPPPPRRTGQDLLTAEEIKLLRNVNVQQHSPAAAAKLPNLDALPRAGVQLQNPWNPGAGAAAANGRTGTDSLQASSTSRLQLLDFSKDPVIDMQKNSSSGLATSPIKASLTALAKKAFSCISVTLHSLLSLQDRLHQGLGDLVCKNVRLASLKTSSSKVMCQ